jgi:hypothetical protein
LAKIYQKSKHGSPGLDTKQQKRKCFWEKNADGQIGMLVYFQTKNPNFGKFWRALGWKMLKYLMAIGNIY